MSFNLLNFNVIQLLLFNYQFINFLLFSQINTHCYLSPSYLKNNYKIKLIKKIWFLNNYQFKSFLNYDSSRPFKNKNILNNKICFWLLWNSNLFLFNNIYCYTASNSNVLNWLIKPYKLDLVFKINNFLFLNSLVLYYTSFFFKFFNFNFFLIKSVVRINFIRKLMLSNFSIKKKKFLQNSSTVSNQNLLQLNYKVL